MDVLIEIETRGLATRSCLGINNWKNIKGKKRNLFQILESQLYKFQHVNGFSLDNG